jgi:hypothetical protein
VSNNWLEIVYEQRKGGLVTALCQQQIALQTFFSWVRANTARTGFIGDGRHDTFVALKTTMTWKHKKK